MKRHRTPDDRGEEFARFDAEQRFGVADKSVDEPADCLSGLVLQGRIKPHECPAFGTKCTVCHSQQHGSDLPSQSAPSVGVNGEGWPDGAKGLTR